jgi:hypothetical protein
MLKITKIIGAAIVCLAFATTGCTTDKPAQNPPPEGKVSLDWATATATFPLQKYTLSADEASVMWAAKNIVASRCLAGGMVPPAEVERSRVMVNTPFESTKPVDHFGLWDAEYLAKNGVTDPLTDTDIFDGAATLNPDEATSERCWKSDEVAAIPVLNLHLQTSSSQPYALPIELHLGAWLAAEEDERGKAIQQEMEGCLNQAGYEVYVDRDGNRSFAANSGESEGEKRDKADLVTAKCSDQLEVMQRMGDIAAGYENQYISEHEAELVQIRQELDEKVEQAHQILREAGVE